MSQALNVLEARAHLSRLVERVVRGEEFSIAEPVSPLRG